MRRNLIGALTVVSLLGAMVALSAQAGQTNPSIGTWKLNLGKSKYSPKSLAPKSQIAKIEASGNGTRNTTTGTASNGSSVNYGYTVNYDGKDYPITGFGSPNGATTIAITRVDANTFESTLKKDGKVVLSNRTVYSADGKLRTITGKGTAESGQATDNVTVYQRQ
jgi:hypothetical protein